MWDPQWDDEVDVVCTDAGVPGLAAAISAVDAGAEVLVASVQPPQVAGPSGHQSEWFTFEGDYAETAAYLAALTDDHDAAAAASPDDDLPIRPAPEPAAAPGRRLPPFIGEHLRAWAARCVSSPSGYLYTRVTDWTATLMECADGDVITVSEIGSLTPGHGDIVGSVLEWLDEEARGRAVDIQPVTRFDRLVFEDGQVIGAVFTTPDGPLAVRARHGVLFCRAGSPAGWAPPIAAHGAATLRVTLVGKAASRFGRVELLTSDGASA